MSTTTSDVTSDVSERELNAWLSPVRVSREMRDAVEERVAAEGVSFSEFIREAVSQKLT